MGVPKGVASVRSFGLVLGWARLPWDSGRIELEPGYGTASGITFESKVGRLVTRAWFLPCPLVEGAGGRTMDKLYWI